MLLAATVTLAGCYLSPLQDAPPVVLAEPVRLASNGAPISTGAHGGHSGPLVTDLDGDGKDDLLVGNYRGHVQVYRNVGTKAEPEYRSEGLLQAREQDLYIHNW